MAAEQRRRTSPPEDIVSNVSKLLDAPVETPPAYFPNAGQQPQPQPQFYLGPEYQAEYDQPYYYPQEYQEGMEQPIPGNTVVQEWLEYVNLMKLAGHDASAQGMPGMQYPMGADGNPAASLYPGGPPDASQMYLHNMGGVPGTNQDFMRGMQYGGVPYPGHHDAMYQHQQAFAYDPMYQQHRYDSEQSHYDPHQPGMDQYGRDADSSLVFQAAQGIAQMGLSDEAGSGKAGKASSAPRPKSYADAANTTAGKTHQQQGMGQPVIPVQQQLQPQQAMQRRQPGPGPAQAPAVPYLQYAQHRGPVPQGRGGRMPVDPSVNRMMPHPGFPQQFQQQQPQRYRKPPEQPNSRPSQTPRTPPAYLNHADYNPRVFDCNPKNARFFVIKSYSEDDVHKCIKYNIWASTDTGNRKLDAAYRDSETKGPVYLFFSVNASGQFCGMAQMISAVDFSRKATVWAQEKWNGQFSVKWIFVKDIPNSQFRHISLPNNEGKPVTNSRDTQEVLPDQGKQMVQIFLTYAPKTSILDDFTFYDDRQVKMEEKRGPGQAPAASPPAPSTAPSSDPSGQPISLLKTPSLKKPVVPAPVGVAPPVASLEADGKARVNANARKPVPAAQVRRDGDNSGGNPASSP